MACFMQIPDVHLVPELQHDLCYVGNERGARSGLAMRRGCDRQEADS